MKISKTTFRRVTPCLLGTLLMVVGCALHTPNEYPGFVRTNGNTFLMENHCHALMAWHLYGVTNSTLVHLDAHDDCRKTSDEKTESLRLLLEQKDYKTIFNHSDTGRFLDFKVSDADMLFDLGNFICPAMELGLVSDVYWVVPQPRIDDNESQRLAAMMKRNLPGARQTGKHFTSGGFEMIWGSHHIRIITLEELPLMQEGCLLDVDIDFFAFPRAMTEEHLVAQVNRNPEDVFRYLKNRLPRPKTVTISASVWGGYLPLLLRFLGEAAFDFFDTGTFPEDASRLLSAYRGIRVNDLTMLEPPAHPQYKAAYLHFSGLTSLATGNTEACRQSIKEAAKLSSVYKKGLLDAAEALTAMKRYDSALQFIEEFETINNGPSYNSTAVKAITLTSAGKPKSALGLTSKLVQWDRNPYTLLIHGGALMAGGQTDTAEETFKNVLQLAPDNSTAHFNLGTIKESAKDLDGAISAYKRAISLRADFWQAYDNLGYLMLRSGDLKAAELLLKKAVAINPFSVSAINNLGLAYARQDDFLQAIPVFRKGARLNPDNTMLNLNLAEALIITGKYDEAKKLCEHILEKGENHKAQELLARASAHLRL